VLSPELRKVLTPVLSFLSNDPLSADNDGSCVAHLRHLLKAYLQLQVILFLMHYSKTREG